MVGKQAWNTAGAGLFAAIAFGTFYLWEVSALTAWSDRIGSELDRTRKMAQLLARTSVVENGLRFGGLEVIESLLNQSVLGERHLDSVWVAGREGHGRTQNTYTADGLYVGMSDRKLPSVEGGFLTWRSSRLSDGRLGLLLSVPVEQDDDPVGTLSVLVDSDEMVRRTASAKVRTETAARVSLRSAGGPFSFSVAVPGVSPALRLVLPAANWWAQASVCAIAGVVCFVLLAASIHVLRAVRAQKTAASEALYRQALQLAHDIRSPVSALRTLDSRMQRLGNEPLLVYRTAVQRIHGVADGLLTKFRAENFGPSYSWLGHVACRLVEEIGSADGLRTIEISGTQCDWNVCVAVRPQELEAALGNVFRNALEASSSQVRIRWSIVANFVHVCVAHDGKRVAYKAIRHGLGLKSLGCLGGGRYEEPVEIVDEAGREWIRCALILPMTTPPVRCPAVLCLRQGAPVVVLDDDRRIADWFRKVLPVGTVLHAWDRNSFLEVVSSLREPAQFIVDFRLGPQEPTGPELLEQTAARFVADGRYLVTSMPEEPGVLAVATRWNAPVFPKAILQHTPVHWVAADDRSSSDIRRAVLVDDDALTCRSWELVASERGVHLRVVRSVEQMDALPFTEEDKSSTRVFIDGGLTTADFLERLERRGFREVYITTGNPTRAARFAASVHGILDKTPPWSV